MPIDTEFRRTVREAAGGRSQRDIAELTGISQPYINQVMNGRIPSREVLLRIAAGLEVEPNLRSRLMALAGYADDAAQGDLDPEARAFAFQFQGLEPKEREIVRSLMSQRDKLRHVGGLIGCVRPGLPWGVQQSCG